MTPVFLRSTGQQVQIENSAQPPALRRRLAGYIRIIIPPIHRGAKCSIQTVTRKALRFGKGTDTDTGRLYATGCIIKKF